MTNIKKYPVFMLFLTFVMTFLSYLVLPYLSIYTINKGISVREVGFAVGFFSLSTAFFSTISLFVVKKIKKALVINMLVIGISYFAYIYAQNFFICLILMLIIGMSSGLISPALKAYMSLEKREISSENLFRTRYMIFCLAIIIAPIISGVLVTYFSVAVSTLFGITAIGHLALGYILCYFYKSEKLRYKLKVTRQQK